MHTQQLLARPKRPSYPRFAITVAVLLAISTAACGDDDNGDTTAGASSSGGSSTATTTTTTSATTTAGSSGTTDGSTSMGSTGAIDEGTYAALVRGTLFTADLAEAQTLHDTIASGGEAAAMMLGDFGHDPLLGTTLLGTTQDEFVSIDQWDNRAGAEGFYGDPMFAELFGMLFSAPPDLQLFELTDWYGWGDLDAANAADPRFVVVVRGRLVEADPAAAQMMHDPVAMGGEMAAMALGDVAHVVYLSVDDSQEFLAFDLWTDSTNLEMFYNDPVFQMQFGALFEAPPTIGVYRSTDWHQW